jgi:hypothetical protein
VSFAAITLYVASQRVFIVVVYFVRKLLDTPTYYDNECNFYAKPNLENKLLNS